MTDSKPHWSERNTSKKKEIATESEHSLTLKEINQALDEGVTKNKPDYNRVNTIEKIDQNQSHMRIQSAMSLQDDHHLEHMILTNYATSSDEDDDESEATKIKNTKKRMNQSDELNVEMKEELLNLTNQITMNQLMSTEGLSNVSQEIFMSLKLNELTITKDDEVDLPESNLYRSRSFKKWENNSPLMKKQKDEMTKQLIYLAKLQNESSNKSNT